MLACAAPVQAPAVIKRPMEFNDFYAVNAVVYAIQSGRIANFVPLRVMPPIRKSDGKFLLRCDYNVATPSELFDPRVGLSVVRDSDSKGSQDQLPRSASGMGRDCVERA